MGGEKESFGMPNTPYLLRQLTYLSLATASSPFILLTKLACMLLLAWTPEGQILITLLFNDFTGTLWLERLSLTSAALFDLHNLAATSIYLSLDNRKSDSQNTWADTPMSIHMLQTNPGSIAWTKICHWLSKVSACLSVLHPYRVAW